MQIGYNNIPAEMRQFVQWICWRYEDRGGTKPTKVPYNPVSGSLASVTDASTWTTFDQAVFAATAPGSRYDGLGFVLTEHDPYTFIDLDYTSNIEMLKQHTRVFEEMDSYSEKSPSGVGLHIIVKGKVPSGKRHNNIEVYSSERYMTMTGNVYLDLPIEPRQDELNALWTAISREQDIRTYEIQSTPQTVSDADIITTALNASNGLKFKELHEGRWEAIYPSQSEADFSYIDIIAFYTQNVEQITRIFQSCPLGQRAKARRQNYVMKMIYRAFDRMVTPVDVVERSAAIERAQEAGLLTTGSKGSSKKMTRSEAQENLRKLWTPTDVTRPPGIMGDIIDFMYESAYIPVWDVALAGALGFMAGVCGRPYNISGKGLNLYILFLAKTGRGKEQISGGISKLLHPLVNAQQANEMVPSAMNFLGPSEISSGQAILRRLENPDKRCFVSIVGEFGIKMQQLAHPRASTSELMLKKVLLDLYNKSGEFDIFGGSEFADKDKNIALVPNPSMSILAESTPSTFFNAIDESLIKDGLLPRFLIIDHQGDKPYDNPDSVNVKPSPELIKNVRNLVVNSLSLQSKKTVSQVRRNKDAEDFLRELSCRVTDLVNTTENDALAELWNRAHAKTLKVAGLQSVGMDMYFPVVDLNAAQWAFNLVARDIYSLSNRFLSGEIGKNNEEVQQAKVMLELVVDYCNRVWNQVSGYSVKKPMHDKKICPRGYLTQRLNQRAVFKQDRRGLEATIDATLRGLCANGHLRELPKLQLEKEFGFDGKAYVLAQPDKLPVDVVE